MHPTRARARARHAAVVALSILLAGAAGADPAGAQNAAPDWNAATAHPDRITLTWAGDPATSQSVTWRTDTTVTAAVAQYALASPGPRFGYEALTVAARSSTLDTRGVPGAGVVARYHSVTLDDLRPDTLYAYRVGDGTRWSEWFHFRTASREPEPFSFIYLGDAQNDILSLWSRVLRGSYAAAPDARFMIHAGDLVNHANRDVEWGEWFRAGGWIHAQVPSVPAAGNHEYRPASAADSAAGRSRLSVFWREQFALPSNGVEGQEEANYFLDYQGARIVVLNSNEAHEAQAAWLERVLADNPNRWTIVTFHHPVFSTAGERDNPALRALWQPIFDRHGVDLVLQGHDHTYARGRTAASTNVPTGVRYHDQRTGTVYVVSVSGAKMYEFKPGQWESYEAQLDRRAENTQLFQVIRVEGDTLRYQAHTATGELYDAFDLVSGDAGNRLVERTPPHAPTRTHADPPLYDRTPPQPAAGANPT